MEYDAAEIASVAQIATSQASYMRQQACINAISEIIRQRVAR